MIAVCRAGEASFQEILGQVRPATPCSRRRAIYMEQSERRTRAALAAIPAGRVPRGRRTSTTTASPSTGRCGWSMAITVGDGAHDGRLHRLRPAGGRAVQLRRRHHGQRVPAAHQVPDHAARPRWTRAASGRSRVIIPPALGAGRRGAGADRALLRADQPADRPRAPRAGAGHARPHPGRRLRRPDADDRLRHASRDRASCSSRAISTPGGTGARPTFDGESAMIIFAGSTARNNPVEVVESRICADAHPALRPAAGLRRGGPVPRRPRHRARVRVPGARRSSPSASSAR